MKVISVNVGLPREILIRDRPVATGIFKQPVAGLVTVGRLNLEGDRQADLRVHGGPDKAVYVYSAEHYDFWRKELGENLPDWGASAKISPSRGFPRKSSASGIRSELEPRNFR